MPFPCHAMNMPFWKRPLKAMAGSWHVRGTVAAAGWRHVGELPLLVPGSLLSEANQSQMQWPVWNSALSENGRGTAWYVWIRLYDFLLVFVTFLLHAVILTNLDECETLRPMINPCVYSDDIPEVTRSYLNEENVLQTALKCTLSLPLGSAEVTN
jgi:hypothetical protein